MPWWQTDGWAAGPWWVFPILMPIVMLVVLFIALTMFREIFWGRPPWWGRRGLDESSQDSALEILRRRFASGEITEQEFEEKRKFLQRS